MVYEGGEFNMQMIDPLLFAIDENDNQKFHRIVNALHLSVFSNELINKASKWEKIIKEDFQVKTIKPSWFIRSIGST